jgi:peptidoglycan/LPS O-acetylase OafA/YrhL
MHATARGAFVGTVRLYLALSVVAAHLWGYVPAPMVTGYLAVIMFFIISGFYMSMIINERYAKLPLRTFYLSRALRLYPVYAAVLLATVWFGYYAELPTVFMKSPFANATMIGIDVIDANHRAVPQAWTISIELEFYLIAPFLVGRSIKLGLAAVVGLIILRLLFLPYDYAGWRYGFAPAVWCFFLLGHVSHRLWTRVSDPIYAGCRSSLILIDRSSGFSIWPLPQPFRRCLRSQNPGDLMRCSANCPIRSTSAI